MAVSPPNILWIVTTQWRGQATGYAGDPNARTPHLDALAAEAVNYVQAVTPHPFGPFARAALLTGVTSPANGVRDYYDPLPPQARTIAHRLGERGYATAFFGKWHLYRRDPAAPLVGEAHARMVVPPAWRGGFEFWEGFESGFLLNDPWLHGSRLPEPVRFAGYQSDILCARTAAWIADIENHRPWFCVVSLEPPHPPYGAPSAGATPGDPRMLLLPANVPCGGEVEARARRELAGYYAHLEATDQAVGRLLAQVTRENTFVVFTSVHGDMHGAHGLFRKGWPHEESIRVPLLVRGAAGRGFRCGVQSSELVSLLDLPRWALQWTQPGARNPEPESELQRISMPSVVRLPHQCDRPWRGGRTRSHKLILNETGAPWLFFDLARDPGEERNLAGDADRAAERMELQRRL
ncbi:MAG: sulfatase-like hydrolase/transferase [Opitutaceae bacterium]